MKRPKNKWIPLLVLLILTLATVACSDTSVYKDEQTVEDQQLQYQRVQPIPFFTYSLERYRAIELYKFRNQAATTYSLITAQGTGQAIYYCPSSGFPLPYDVQLTNPLQYYNSGAVLEQAEPNGLYSSKSSDATWVFCTNENGDVEPVYTEQKATTWPHAVQFNPETGMWERVDDSTSSIVIKPPPIEPEVLDQAPATNP